MKLVLVSGEELVKILYKKRFCNKKKKGKSCPIGGQQRKKSNGAHTSGESYWKRITEKDIKRRRNFC